MSKWSVHPWHGARPLLCSSEALEYPCAHLQQGRAFTSCVHTSCADGSASNVRLVIILGRTQSAHRTRLAVGVAGRRPRPAWVPTPHPPSSHAQNSKHKRKAPACSPPGKNRCDQGAEGSDKGPGGLRVGGEAPQGCSQPGGIQTPRDQVVDHLMETEGLNGTKPKAGEMQVMLILYQLSSSHSTMALSHPLWASKNSPGPKSGRRRRQQGMGAVQGPDCPQKVPSPPRGSRLPRSRAWLILQRHCAPHSPTQGPGDPGFSQGHARAGSGPRVVGRGTSSPKAGLSNVSIWGWCPGNQGHNIPRGCLWKIIAKP